MSQGADLKVCRVCLSQAPESEAISIEESVGEVQIWKFIEDLGNVCVRVGDELPQLVCSACLEALQNAWTLKKSIETSDLKLRNVDITAEIKIETVELKEEPPEDELPPRRCKGRAKMGLPLRKNRGKWTITVPKCCMCHEDFEVLGDLKKHCLEVHPEGLPENKRVTGKHRNECPYCRRKFRTRQFLFEHHYNLDYQEPSLDRKKHMSYNKQYSTREKVVCPICGQMLRDRHALELHEASKHSIKTLFCSSPGCKTAFGHPKSLNKHMQECHGEKKFVCDFCGKGFGAIRALKQHIFKHLETKPFQCDKCSKTFTLQRVLEAHILATHSGIEYPHQCDQCDKAYKWKEDLRAHRMTHFGRFPHVCKNCGKGYTSSSSKNYHEQRCSQIQVAAAPLPAPNPFLVHFQN